MMKKRRILLAIIILLVAGCLAVVLVTKPDRYHTPERIAWKDKAISELHSLDCLSGMPAVEFTHDGWFSPEGLLLADGSWIVYRSMCHKEIPEIYDIFIGRGSDGKWYYSSYHFCVGAMTITMEEQPESLEAFIEQCALKEFDGRSDECLLPTWPTAE